MRDPTIQRILTINTGSSSLKVAVYELGQVEGCPLFGEVDRVGRPAAHLRLRDSQGATVMDQEGNFQDHGSALAALLEWLRRHRSELRLDAVGHRVVHGGSQLTPRRITPKLIDTLRGLVPLAPDHMPQALQTIEVTRAAYPELPQVACFDTAFHRHMPRLAQIYPLSRHFADEGIIRYGFHGLSYESIQAELRATAPEEAAGRVAIAHLGNGASMVAMRDGVSVDTTMGFSPTGGLMMGTRPGDLDPGVLLYLLAERGMTTKALNEVISSQAGLIGVSGISADMRDLLERETADKHAAEAVALFCYQARKHLGALVAIMGGLDTLVFTGGIGEHAAAVRQRIAQDLEFLGIRIDPQRNEAHAAVISPEGGSVTVRVVKTNEELMIAQHTRELVESSD